MSCALRELPSLPLHYSYPSISITDIIPPPPFLPDMHAIHPPPPPPTARPHTPLSPSPINRRAYHPSRHPAPYRYCRRYCICRTRFRPSRQRIKPAIPLASLHGLCNRISPSHTLTAMERLDAPSPLWIAVSVVLQVGGVLSCSCVQLWRELPYPFSLLHC